MTALRFSMVNGSRWDKTTRTDHRVVTVEIEDNVSGETLARVELDAEQFTALLTNTSFRVDGFVTPHFERVGKRMENTEFKVPRDLPIPASDRTLRRWDEPAERFLEAWAREQDWAKDWETFEPRHHNSGWGIIVRRWVTP